MSVVGSLVDFLKNYFCSSIVSIDLSSFPFEKLCNLYYKKVILLGVESQLSPSLYLRDTFYRRTEILDTEKICVLRKLTS